MKRKINGIALLILFTAGAAGAADYSLSLKKDLPIAAGAALLFTVSRIMEGTPGPQQPREEINGLDSLIIRPFSKSLDTAGTVTCLALLAAPGSLSAISGFDWDSTMIYGTMYTEAFILTTGVKDLTKTLVSRWRPYTYFQEKPAEDDDDYDNSFPSGHTAYAFMGASFLSTILMTDYKDEPWALPVSAGAFLTAAATAGLRTASGEHFITDVLAGAAAGTLCGWLIPALHRKSEENADGIQVLPGAAGISVHLSF